MTAEIRAQLADMQGPLLRGMIQHLNYLTRVEQTIAGMDDFAGTTHTECALGRMMLSFHTSVPRILPRPLAQRWWQLDQCHAEFHASTGLALSGADPDAADRMELQSLRIVELLGSLENDVASLLTSEELAPGSGAAAPEESG